jgi:PII-like signaling protein
MTRRGRRVTKYRVEGLMARRIEGTTVRRGRRVMAKSGKKSNRGTVYSSKSSD